MNVGRAGKGFTLGFSPIGGTLDNKDKTTGLSGSVVSLNGPLCGRFKGSVCPRPPDDGHELRSLLGVVPQKRKAGNLMCQTGKARKRHVHTTHRSSETEHQHTTAR